MWIPAGLDQLFYFIKVFVNFKLSLYLWSILEVESVIDEGRESPSEALLVVDCSLPNEGSDSYTLWLLPVTSGPLSLFCYITYLTN